MKMLLCITMPLLLKLVLSAFKYLSVYVFLFDENERIDLSLWLLINYKARQFRFWNRK